MRLIKIQVSKLFGVFDHVIPLNSLDRITIVHGPNGYGKTAMLLMVQSLLGNQFAKLRRVSFDRFTITMEDNREISVTKKPTKSDMERDQNATTLLFHLKSPGKDQLEEFALPLSTLRESAYTCRGCANEARSFQGRFRLCRRRIRWKVLQQVP